MTSALLLLALWGCGEELQTYSCACTQIAYGAGPDGEDIDDSFTETICETEENMARTFNPGGDLYLALDQCRRDYSELTDDYECDCTCEYLESCE
jgi:hypothetical protein